MKKALPFAIAMLFLCPLLTSTTASANDGGKSKGSPSVLHQDHGKSWIDKAWDDLMNLFKSHHDNGKDKDKGKGPDKGPGHRDGPGSGNNANGGGNGNGWGNGGDGSGGYGGSGNGGSGGSSPSAPLDGGLSLLMIAGVGLGVKKTFRKKKAA